MKFSDIPILGGLFSWMESEDVNYGVIAFVLGIIMLVVVIKVIDITEVKAFTFLFATAPIWLPYLAFLLFFERWTMYVGKKFEIKSGRVLMEIVLPPEVFKSPEAMELAFNQIYNKATPDNLMETYLDGKRPPIYTFEMVSKGGDVRFYATAPIKNAQAVKEALYAQYPGVEVKDIDIDYTAEIPGDLSNWAMMSFHMSKKKDSEIPIKTYLDFGLDKFPKEEEKVDPMTPMIEMLAGIKPQQQMWIQFIYKAHREESFKNGQLRSKDTWESGVQKKIEEIMKRDSQTDLEGVPRLTPGERELVEAMERNMGKMPFEFACRVIYLSKDPTDYDGALFSRFLRSFAATEISKRNGLGARWRTDFNYKFLSDPFGKIIPSMKKQELKEYKLRVLYAKTSAMGFKIMTAEELATIFHLPGKVALTPTLNRVQSTRGEAPMNLPTGKL